MEERFLAEFCCVLRRSCKFRRLFGFLAVMICTGLLTRIVHHRFYESRWPSGDASSGEYSGGDLGQGMAAPRNPKDEPGYFLRGKQPLDNGSYCSFNYGLPERLDWDAVKVSGTPQLGRKSPYRIVYDAIERSLYNKSHSNDFVTYATHVTPEFLYHVVEIARYWDGPVSVAAFVPDYDLDVTMRLFSHLCRCYEGMAKVSLHLVYPLQDRPRFINAEEPSKRRQQMRMTSTMSPSTTTTTQNTSTRYETKAVNVKALVAMDLRRRQSLSNSIDFEDCSMPDLSRVTTFRGRHGLVYPVNVARNAAKNASRTQYTLVSDVEMIPSEDLARRFIVMIRRHRISGRYGVIPKWRLAFVVPVFEVESGEDVPRNKSTLQQLYADGKAVYFHRWVCSHCQKIPDIQTWMKEDPGRVMKPFAVTKRQFPYHRWEPLYISTKHAPWYSETLSWEGMQDKMTQMLEMCLKSYDFVIVNGAFLCHSPGIKTKSKHKSWRYRHELVNTKQYDLIVKGLAEKYPANPKCRLE